MCLGKRGFGSTRNTTGSKSRAEVWEFQIPRRLPRCYMHRVCWLFFVHADLVRQTLRNCTTQLAIKGEEEKKATTGWYESVFWSFARGGFICSVFNISQLFWQIKWSKSSAGPAESFTGLVWSGLYQLPKLEQFKSACLFYWSGDDSLLFCLRWHGSSRRGRPSSLCRPLFVFLWSAGSRLT